MNKLDYPEIINYLFTRLPMFQRKGPAAYKNNLENTRLLDEYYKTPHKKFKTIHVGGTNGKGSVAHMLASVLQVAGYKTGLYTSPHLNDFRERIRINGEMMSKEAVVEWVQDYKIKNRKWKLEPSFFELTVAMAFDYFASEGVDVAVVEVGLGGRLDSTNIIEPEVSVITNIGLDHTALLGDTLEQIAFEKAGIIKSGVPVVVGSTQKEVAALFAAKADKLGSPIYFADQNFKVEYAMLSMDGKQQIKLESKGKEVYPELKLDLRGEYQLQNVCTALTVIEVLSRKGWLIPVESVYGGLADVQKNTGLMGRWQIIGNNPLVVCDTGHNADGVRKVMDQVQQTPHDKLHVIFGTVVDKDAASILSLLPADASYYFVRANIERAMDARELQKLAGEYGLRGEVYSSVKEALDSARIRASAQDLILVGGSTFVVAEIL